MRYIEIGNSYMCTLPIGVGATIGVKTRSMSLRVKEPGICMFYQLKYLQIAFSS